MSAGTFLKHLQQVMHQPSKFPDYDSTKDGNPFEWIAKEVEAIRAKQLAEAAARAKRKAYLEAIRSATYYRNLAVDLEPRFASRGAS